MPQEILGLFKCRFLQLQIDHLRIFTPSTPTYFEFRQNQLWLDSIKKLQPPYLRIQQSLERTADGKAVPHPIVDRCGNSGKSE